MRRELRDPSEPCEHGYRFSHAIDANNVAVSGPQGFNWCPGGKLVVMEVLTDECWTSRPLGGHIVLVDDDVRAIVDTVGLAPVPVWVEVTP